MDSRMIKSDLQLCINYTLFHVVLASKFYLKYSNIFVAVLFTII